jgi:hypothetical protein
MGVFLLFIFFILNLYTYSLACIFFCTALPFPLCKKAEKQKAHANQRPAKLDPLDGV